MQRLYVLGLVLGLTLLAGCGAPYQFTGSVINPPKPTADFTVSNQDGQPFQLSAQRGNVVLLYFGFTNCPDACPATLGDWKQIKQALGPDADKVRFVMVSVDPDRDTEPVLKEYVGRFDPTFIGLRPTPEQLATLSKDYGVGVQPANTSDHSAHTPESTMHGTYSYAIDPAGQLRLLFASDSDPRQVAADVQQLLRTN